MTKFEEFKGKVKDKYLKFRDKAGKVADAAKEWAKDHPEEAAGIVCSAIFVGGGTVLGIVKDRSKEKKEYYERETRQYDPSSGMYYYTKRPLTKNEKLELDTRMQLGERKGQILKDMRLL